jgi:3D (Asp-Asp-Asp) domain-containing protein
MISRIFPLAALAAIVACVTSCGGPDVAVLPKSKIRGAFASAGQVTLPPPSPQVIAAAANKPKDKHSMPVYTFSERTRMVRTTAYTCSEDDHLIYGSRNATGTPLRYTNRVRSAAADWSFYPVGTAFRIKGLPYLYVVDDYGSALTGTGTIDIYKPDKEVMKLWGRRNVEITIVQWGSFTRSAEILSQRTKFPHCSQMLANIVRQRPDLQQVVRR